jgi:hypothetical protein
MSATNTTTSTNTMNNNARPTEETVRRQLTLLIQLYQDELLWGAFRMDNIEAEGHAKKLKQYYLDVVSEVSCMFLIS